MIDECYIHAMCTCSTHPSYVSAKVITNQILLFYVSLLAQACPTVQCILVVIFCNTTKYDQNNMYHSPVLAEYTPMYMDWITFIASGISQR